MQTSIPVAKQPFATASKRKKDSSHDDQFLQQELLSLPEKLADIESLIQTNRDSNDESFNELISAVNNLTKVVSEKLDTIILLLKSPNKNTSVKDATVTSPQTNTVLEKLRDLKNARNSSVYKLSYNNTHKDIYSNGLLQNPQLVPRKLHETINARDSDEMLQLKKKRTVRKIEDELETLSYHAKIHESKIISIDSKAHELLENISNLEERNRVANKWRHLVAFGQEAIEKKWQAKRVFLLSDKHLIALGNKQRETSSFFNSNSRQRSLCRYNQENCDKSWKTTVQPSSHQNQMEASSFSQQDVDMDSEWTVVRNSKNSLHQQRSPRLHQQH